MISKAIAHVNMIKQHSYCTLNAIRGNKDNSLEIFLILMLDRLHNSCKSLELLLNDYEKHPTHDFSIGIILRSLLLDTIITINLQNEIEKNKLKSDAETKQLLEEKAEHFLSDGFNRIIKEVMSSNESIEIIGNFFHALINRYPAFFEEYQNDNSKPEVKNKKLEQGVLYETIRNSPNLKKLIGIVDRYNYYSKYDHFNFIHYDLMRQENKDKIRLITTSLEDLVFHSLTLHLLLVETYPEDFYIKQSNLIIDYFSRQVLYSPKELSGSK